MKISRDEVEHVALLARLRLEEKEIEQFTGQINAILDYMDQLNGLATEEVEATSHVIRLGNVIREDEVKASLPEEITLANAPDRDQGFFKVPRIL